MRTVGINVLALAVAIVVIGSILQTGAAKAGPSHLTIPQSMAAWPDSVGGYEDSFPITCATTATQIIPPTGRAMLSYTCQNPSTTIVGVGDSGLADPDSGTRTSPVYCATNCPSQEWGGNSRWAYCRADSGTVTIYCRALAAVSP